MSRKTVYTPDEHDRAQLEREYNEYLIEPTPTRKTRVKMVAYAIVYHPKTHTPANIARANQILANLANA